MGICLYLNNRLTSVYLAVDIFWPKRGQSQCPRHGWSSHTHSSGTPSSLLKAQDSCGAGSERSSSELRKGQSCLSPAPHTLPVHLLQCVTNPRASVRNPCLEPTGSNSASQMGTTGLWRKNGLCRKQSRRNKYWKPHSFATWLGKPQPCAAVSP